MLEKNGLNKKALDNKAVLELAPSFHLYDHSNEQHDLREEIIQGLGAAQKYISPKFFYDEIGSRLFTAITRQPEYYLTRTEIGLLKQHAAEIGTLVGEGSLLIEYGSGSSEKIRTLLDSLRPGIYAPLDISRDYLAEAARSLAQEYPWLEVRATCVDFTAEFDLPFTSPRRRVSFFPGSGIGNFNPDEASEFLVRARRLVGPQGGLLIGVDLKKDQATLNAAYNDAEGVTAQFNLNVLAHLNRAQHANFDLSQFAHQAAYNGVDGRVEMHLVSRCSQTVTLGGETYHFRKGESIHTENSYKYDLEEFILMAEAAGFNRAEHWVDDHALFCVLFLYSEGAKEA